MCVVVQTTRKAELVAEAALNSLMSNSGVPWTLTRFEWVGLANEHNLADGHARQSLSPGADRVIERLSEVFRAAEGTGQLELQHEFERVFWTAAGQHSVLGRSRPLLHHYSSSLSIEIVANHLRRERLSVGLLHPTFDNIPDILRRQDVQVTPVPEAFFAEPEDGRWWDGFEALFLVVPNNPTGLDPAVSVLKRVARKARARGVLLIIDFSFRFFSDELASEDLYGFLDEEDIDYIGIEDVGKAWPTLDLKVGTLVCGHRRQADLQAITDDLLLNVSPFVFALLAEYAKADVLERAREVSRTNRAALLECLHGGPLRIEGNADGCMSVAWAALPKGWDAFALCTRLAEQGISVLPGGPFYWAEPARGSSYVRVALMRDPVGFRFGVCPGRRGPRLRTLTPDRKGRPERMTETNDMTGDVQRVVLDRARAARPKRPHARRRLL